jgi:hypothetical protein
MYFHNKLIWSHKCEYYLLETWSDVKHLKWHVTHSCILLGTEVVYCKLGCYIGPRSTQIYGAGKETYALATGQWRRLCAPTSPTGGNNSHNAYIWVGSPLNTSSYVIADVDGGGIPLESPGRFMTRYSPCLAVEILAVACAAIRLLRLGSDGGVCSPRAASSPGSSRSGGCLVFVTRSVKCLRRLSVEVVWGEGV